MSLAKKSIREFDLIEGSSRKIKKKKQTKPVVKESVNGREETIKKLLLLNTTTLDEKTSRKVSLLPHSSFLFIANYFQLMKSATNSKRKVIKYRGRGKTEKTKEDSSDEETPAADEAIFTEEDFQKFAEEYHS